MKQLNQKKKFKFTHTIGLTLVIAALILTGGTLAGINELSRSFLTGIILESYIENLRAKKTKWRAEQVSTPNLNANTESSNS